MNEIKVLQLFFPAVIMKAQDRGADWNYIVSGKNPQDLQKQVGAFPAPFLNFFFQKDDSY